METTKKSLLTNREALELAIALANEASNNELAEKLSHMARILDKKRQAPKSPSKTQLQNRALAKTLLDAMPDEAIGTAWVMDHITGVMTPQKATAIFKILIEDGTVVKTEPVNGKVYYQKVD